MTISTTESRISYNGNGVTTIFSFPYRFLANINLVVVEVSAAGVETVKTLTTHYTLTGAGDDAGGSVTMLAAPASGVRLIIYRDTEIVQETDYISGDPFPAETHETAIDRLTMIAQEVGSDADRAIKVPVGDSSSLTTTLPAAANRLDKFIVFDATTGETELSTVTQTQVASAVAAAYAAGSTADAVTFLQAGTGAVSRTVQSKLREWVSAADFTGYDSTGTTDSAAAITAALAAANEVMIVGTPLIASTITVPTGKKLTFQGGLGNTLAAYPPSYLIKKSTMTTNGITISERAWVSGGGLFCQAGNTGDGVALVGNSAKLDHFLVHAAGGVGVRVGTTAGANCNSFQLEHVVSQYNGSHGIYIHDGKAAEGADANAGTLIQCFAQFNTGSGFYLGHCFWNTLLNCLSEQNTGWGLFISSTVNGSAAESRYHTIIGGDYNEVNTAGVASIGGYACSVYQPDQNQGFTLSGTFVNHFGGSNSTIDTITLGRGQIVFPAVAVPSSNANTLDDYEEGTFTATVIGTSTAGSASYSLQQARYTKIGRIVFIDIALTWTGGTGTGNMRISGLPFTANADTYGCLCVGQASNVVLTASNVLCAFVDPTVAYVSLTQNVVGGGASTSVAYDAAGTLLLSGSYSI